VIRITTGEVAMLQAEQYSELSLKQCTRDASKMLQQVDVLKVFIEVVRMLWVS